MSFLHITCPWCGTEYTFGLVGSDIIGYPHTTCEGHKRCQMEGCEEDGNYFVMNRIGPDYADYEFSCEKHICDRAIYMFKPDGKGQ